MQDVDGFAKVVVDGIPITRCRTDDVRTILERALSGEGRPRRLATVNLDFLRLASETPELAEALRAGDHNFADGWPLLTLASLRGDELPERVTGSDLTPRVFEWASELGFRVGLVGASEETRRALEPVLRARYGSAVAGHWTPDYRGRPLRDPELCRAIREAGAGVLLVALGCPRQEVWIRDNLDETGARAAMGVGGSLDFLAGTQRRAPRLVQRLRAEWLYRALSDPRRLAGRYARDLLYFDRLLLEHAWGRLAGR